MLRNLFTASLILVSQCFAADPTTANEWSLGEITLIRTDTSGKVLSEAKAPLAVYLAGDFDTDLVINMGTGAAPRLWTVGCEYHGEGTKWLRFAASDITRTIAQATDGNIRREAPRLFDIRTSWHGAGRYPVFTMDGETLTAEIHPVAGTKIDNDDGADSKAIVVTRRDRSNKILNQTTVPWQVPSCSQRLAIQCGTKDAPQTRLVECIGESNSFLFYVWVLLPIKEELGGTQVQRLKVIETRSPTNTSGKYMIQELDGEILEAEIRSAGKLKPDDQLGQADGYLTAEVVPPSRPYPRSTKGDKNR
jgi:hypothetical protein